MLAPNKRSLYVEALVPPLGFQLRDAVATTYSADPEVLLGVPIHLALAERSIPDDLDASAVAVVGALKRLAGRMTVFAQSGLVKVPSKPHALYSLLEPLLIDVRGKSGAFHAKLWVLRFDNEEGESRLRLIVPTRNLTSDRCWDAALVLDGAVVGGPKAANRPLADLLTALPDLAVHAESVTPALREQVASIVQDVRRAEWEGPGDWEVIAFHVGGLSRKATMPIEPSEELLVVSPFLSVDALKALADSTERARALLSRPEELARIGQAAFSRFDDVRVMVDAAGADPDGEEPLESRLRGLHAKLYIATTRSTTELYIGSANATHSGLMGGVNVEILVQLRAKRRGARPIDDFLGEGGMGLLLEPFDPATEPDPTDGALEKRLELAQDAIASALLTLRAEGADDAWFTWLESAATVDLPSGMSVRAWPITHADSASADASALVTGAAVRLAEGPVALLTGLVAFELREGDQSLRFVRNLPVRGMPAAREGELLRAIITSRDAFVALMLALFGESARAALDEAGNVVSRSASRASGPRADGAGLLEHLVRACATDRPRLKEAIEVVSSLQSGKVASADLVPDGFADLLKLLQEVSQ